MAKKSYWQSVVCQTASDHDAIRKWFPFLCEDMTPYQCDVLCDVETDREKKLRAYMTDKSGKRWYLSRTTTRKGDFTITQKPLEPAT